MAIFIASSASAFAQTSSIVAGASQPPASGVDDEIAVAKQLIETGRHADAKQVLETLLAKAPQDVEIMFLLGMIAIADNNLQQAIKRFRQALVHEPNALRIRLELARAHYFAKEYDNAYRQFQFARAGELPDGVALSIDRFLAAIRKEKNWSYAIGIAIAPDSNINNATSAQETIIFGLPFELDQSLRQRSGIGLDVSGNVEFEPRVNDELRLRLGASGRRREYDGTSFDDMTLAGHIGSRLQLEKWDLSVMGGAFRRWYGGRELNEGYGPRIEATHFANSRSAYYLALSAQKVRYFRSSFQNGASFSAIGGWVRTLSPSSSLNTKLGIIRQTANARDLASWSYYAGIGYYRDLAGGFSVNVEPSFLFTKNDIADPFFGVRRRDRLAELQIAVLNRRIVLDRFTPRIAYTFAKRDSSIDLYSYNQHRFEFGFTSKF